ncbi:hypothetical protein Ahia01_001187500 [Argonauta hians]
MMSGAYSEKFRKLQEYHVERMRMFASESKEAYRREKSKKLSRETNKRRMFLLPLPLPLPPPHGDRGRPEHHPGWGRACRHGNQAVPARPGSRDQKPASALPLPQTEYDPRQTDAPAPALAPVATRCGRGEVAAWVRLYDVTH